MQTGFTTIVSATNPNVSAVYSNVYAPLGSDFYSGISIFVPQFDEDGNGWNDLLWTKIRVIFDATTLTCPSGLVSN